MGEKKLKVLAVELDKGLKTEVGLNQFSCILTTLTVENALLKQKWKSSCVISRQRSTTSREGSA
ncbi:hypothetical protein RC77_11575 [Pectobacterium brasiliense]|nr:hypothetical protein RC77_11575 [Pectobacterium brasiliense]